MNARPPFSKNCRPLKRCSVLITSRASPVNGAFSATRRSRFGTLFLRSPLSSASTHISVAESVGRHCMLRGPVITPLIGTRSSSGWLATLWSTFPVRSQISISLGNDRASCRYENGRWIVVTRMFFPSGEMRADSMMPALPIGVAFPVATSTTASCEVA